MVIVADIVGPSVKVSGMNSALRHTSHHPPVRIVCFPQRKKPPEKPITTMRGALFHFPTAFSGSLLVEDGRMFAAITRLKAALGGCKWVGEG
jgi:hypothetical protein